ncbi:MAG: Rieske 2Fe-2S domain-containing protein [Pseudomonadota bacterium]|nr:Rieske 2Fe-2S domain-containing protein [Pseudomonadota bacterium]
MTSAETGINKVSSRFGAFQAYPRNMWYVAAGRSEVTEKPMGRRLVDTPVVLFRKQDGGVVAMRDGCPHRGYPLSKSTVKGDTIQCRYHGITFNAQGRCIHMPVNPGTAISDAMRVTVYPTVEKWHWVWIWLGDASKADPSLIPDFECERYEHYDHCFYSPLGPFHGSLQLLNDNLCDATHTSFLHAGLLDDADDTQMALAEVQVDRMEDRVVRITRDMMNFVPNEDVARLYHLRAGERYNRRLEVWHHFPHALTAFNRYYTYTERFDREHAGELAAEHITALGLTPASHNQSYHFTAASTSWEQTDIDREGLLFVIQQDIEAFGEIQTYFENYGDGAVEVSVPSDRLGMLSRRIINEMVRREQAQQGAAA